MLLLALACMSEPAEQAASSVDADVTHNAHRSELQAVDATPRTVGGLIANLGNEETSQSALAALIAIGPDAVGALEKEAASEGDTTSRGWALQALAQIDDDGAEDALARIHANESDPLIRSWAAAARIQQADTLDELMALNGLQWEHSSLNRPFKMKAESLAGDITDIGAAILLLTQDSSMTAVVAPALEKATIRDLSTVMLTDANQSVRITAAGLLAGRPDQAREIARQYAFTPGAEAPLWSGGALYVPNLGWKKKDAKILVGNLVAWYVFCDVNGFDGEKQQIMNNLNSLGLVNIVGMDWPSADAKELLVQYGDATSQDSARRILAEQGLLDDKAWAAALDRI